MKVLFVVFEFQDAVSGGLARVVNGLSPELASLVELHVARVVGGRFRRRRLQLHQSVERQQAERKHRALLDHPDNLVRLVAEEGYDVVHFFCVNPIMTEKIERLKARLPATKLVFSVHNLFKYEQRLRPTTPDFLREEHKTLALVDHVHVLNRACLGFLEQSYPELAARKGISIIPNGLDSASFQSRDAEFLAQVERRIPGRPLVISCVSRWAPGKGLEFLTDAVLALTSQREDVFLILAGRKEKSWETGSSEYVRKIDERVTRLGKRALVLGWLDEAQRNSLFELSHVSVMPSQLEYFPYGSLEPLHQDVPLVQSRLPCLDPELRHEEHCFFFEPGNPQDLGDKLRSVLEQPEWAQSVARRGGAKVRTAFSWPAIALEYRAMYQGLTAGASARAS